MTFLEKQKCYRDKARYSSEFFVLRKIGSSDYEQVIRHDSRRCRKKDGKKPNIIDSFMITNRLK